jgi:CubicO group peptidase (beta-lactamase class C family)
MMVKMIPIIFWVVLIGVAFGQADFAQLDDYIQTQMRRNGIPGVSIAITQGDQVVYAKGYGIAGQGRAMTPDTPMYIGSTSKSFTALAIMQLVEQGKIDLNAPVQTYIPWFTLADQQAASHMTVQHLLGHNSGLSDLQYLEIVHLANSASIEDGVRDLRRARPIAPVGSSFHYFNPGYATLGFIIEQVSGQSYETYIQEHILEPLEMNHTFTDPILAQRNGLAQGYSLMFGFAIPRQQVFRRYGLPAGYIMSTANDMANYLIAMNNHGRFGDARLLSVAGMLALHSPSGPGNFYAKGWMIGQYRGLRLIQHGGATEFFKHEALMLPERGLGLIMMVNQGYLPSAIYVYNPMALGILDLILGFQPQNVPTGLPLTMRQIGWILLAVLALQLAFIGWHLSRLGGWLMRTRQWSASRRMVDIALNFLITPLIAVGILYVMRDFMGRGFALRQSFDGIPDAVILLLVGFLADYAQGIGKIWLLTRGTKPRSQLASVGA